MAAQIPLYLTIQTARDTCIVAIDVSSSHDQNFDWSWKSFLRVQMEVEMTMVHAVTPQKPLREGMWLNFQRDMYFLITVSDWKLILGISNLVFPCG